MTATSTGGQDAGRRAARNTGISAAGDIVGKLATLVLLAVLAREVGAADFGVFVFALAFLGITMIPVGFGTDSYLLREVARDRARPEAEPGPRALDELFWSVVSLKVAVSVPVLAISFVTLEALGYPGRTQTILAVLAVGLLLEVFARTFQSLFQAYERSEYVALGVVIQRLFTLVAGVGALLAGQGLLGVAAMYSVGSLINAVIVLRYLRRLVPLPRATAPRRRWRALTSASFPFAVQDVFTVLLFKLDAVLLSVLAAEAAVGRYGGAYRLLEATLFVGYAVNYSVAAMYTYLDHDSEPSVADVFGRSIKLVLVVLVPVAIVLGLLAEPIVVLIFGDGLAGAGSSLQLLAPVVVAVAVVTLSATLVNSRRSTTLILRVSAVVLSINIALNLVLIPRFAEDGAALAMLLTEGPFAFVALAMAARVVGGLAWSAMLAGPALGGVAMSAVILALRDLPLVAGVAGGVVYLLTLVAWERVRSPRDLDFIVGLLRRRGLPVRPAA